MTDEIKNETNAAGQPDETMLLGIYMTKGGGIQVKGVVINDIVTSYGLLELAKAQIEEHIKMNQPKIHKPHGGIMGFVRGNGNGRH